MSLWNLKKKVLLIDMDLRKSVMVSRLQAQHVDKGLTHFLSGQCMLSDVVMSAMCRNCILSSRSCDSKSNRTLIR